MIAATENVVEDQIGDVVIILDNGQSVAAVDAWTYRIPGTIQSIDPRRGQQSTTVTLQGINLLGYGTVVSDVTLVGESVTSINFQNDTYIEVTAAPNSNGLGDVVITNDNGAITSVTDGFSYVAVPEIDSVSPGTGQVDTRVTIEGSGLHGGGSSTARVSLSGLDVSSILEDTDSKIVVAASASRPNRECLHCHSTCASCSGPPGGAADECLSCPLTRRPRVLRGAARLN